MGRHPEKAAMVKAYRAQTEALKKLFDIDYPMPKALETSCERWKVRLAQKLNDHKVPASSR